MKDSKIFLKKKNKTQKKTRERCQNLTEEEKEKRRNRNLSVEQKQNLVQYRIYCLTHNK